MSQEPKANTISFLTLNQTEDCFSIIDEEGFKVFNVFNNSKTVERHFGKNSLKMIEMMYKSNIFVFVGTGTNSEYPPTKAILWDDHQCKAIGELSFRSEIKAVKLKKDRIIIVLEHKAYIYNFSDLKLIDSMETFNNSSGICSLCKNNNSFATLGINKGSIRIELYDLKKSTIIDAHRGNIQTICLNGDASLIATSSDSGTIIRIFNTSSGSMINEFRRGVDTSTIYSLAFNENSTFLLVTSSKCSYHIYSLTSNISNTSSVLSFMGDYLPSYFKSIWSFKKIVSTDNTRSIGFFNSFMDFVIIGFSGNIYKYTYTDNEYILKTCVTFIDKQINATSLIDPTWK